MVILHFWDHSKCGGPARVIPCKVRGLLYQESKEAYHIVTWSSDGCIDENAESYAILKKTLIEPMRQVGWDTL